MFKRDDKQKKKGIEQANADDAHKMVYMWMVDMIMLVWRRYLC
jgi:hypothetical protein